jgi:Na+:H+ antiporter, NhaA family
VGLVGAVGGIGFTMSLFIAQLAFEPGPMLETAKLAIICGSVGAALVSALLARLILSVPVTLGAARSEGEAEASTET